MEKEVIIKKAHEYIDSNLSKNADWMGSLTDSWIYDAENWFLDLLGKEITIYEDEEEYEYTKEAEELVSEFWGAVREYHDEKYAELYGVRDAAYILRGILYDLDTKYGEKLETLESYLKDSDIPHEHIEQVKTALSRFKFETNMLLREVKSKKQYEKE